MLLLAPPVALAAPEAPALRAPVPFRVLEDPTGTAPLQAIVSAPDFVAVEGPGANLGLSDSAWWLRFTLPATPDAEGRILTASWALIDEATLYVPRGDGSYTRIEGGRATPPTERSVVYRQPAFRLPRDIPSGEPVFLRVRGKGTMLVPLEIFSREGFEEKRRGENIVLGAFFGVLALMTVFGGTAYAFLREPMFLSYAVMVAGFALWQASTEGLLSTYVWPTATGWFVRALPLFGLLFGTGAVLFTRAYLQVAERLPALDRCMFPAGPIAVAGLVLWAIVRPGPLLVMGVVIVTILGATWALTGSILSFRQGYRPANYLMLSWSVGCVAAIAQALRAVGWVESNPFSDFGLQAAVVFTFVSMSLGMVDRMVGMREDLEQSVDDIRRLEREDAAKRTFLATASHDLRQPLHAVGLLLGALRARLTDAESIDLVEKIQSATTEMADMFNALLDISRLDAGLVEARPAEVPLGPLLDRLRDEFAVQARNQGIELHVEDSREIVRSDPVLLGRILRNLLTNALRYTDAGTIRVSARPIDDEVALAVSDTGRGIPEDARDEIFEPFRRLAPGAEASEALGLGLAIVHRLTRLLGHSISLESNPDRGTTFRLRVARASRAPVAWRASPGSEAASEAATEPGRGRREVLVLDDDPAVREGMRAQLESWGHRVSLAATSAEALASVAETRPDVVFVDYQLGDGTTGIDAIDQIRRTIGADVPSFVVSGDTSASVADAIRARGLLLLTKPVQPSRLRLALAHADRQTG